MPGSSPLAQPAPTRGPARTDRRVSTDRTASTDGPASAGGPASTGGTVSGPDDIPIPEPPWRAGRRRGAARPALSREAIVDAALAVLDREGVDGLSMRKVGEALGTGAASLYWHVRNKEELLQLVFERVSDSLPLPVPDPYRWQEQLKDLARRMRRLMVEHRDFARISLGRVPVGPAMARASEWAFSLLTPVGIPDQVIGYLADLLPLYVGAYGYEQSLGMVSPTGEDASPEQIVAIIRDYVLSLPEERFPHTRRAVDALLGGDRDERFEFGLDLMVRGIETYARPAPERGAKRPAAVSGRARRRAPR
jgi:AcrR family transcriptional regulator